MREAKPLPVPSVSPSAGDAAGEVRRPDSALTSRTGAAAGKPVYLEGQEPTIGPLARSRKLPKHPKFKSGPVPTALYPQAPIRSNGKLFMAFGEKLFTCSATVIPSGSHKVILTAGHCIFNKKRGFADRVAFIPGYFAAHAAHGFWVGRDVVTNGEWVHKTNEKFDYAAVRVYGPQGAVGKVVGESGLAINAGRRHRELALGYPFNRGRTEIMWACASRLIGEDPFDHGRGKKNIAIGCDMSHGSSGGSWEIRRKGRYYVNSVTSYFYASPRFDKILFGPYLTKHARKVIHRASH
jgi:V8-like Glu-specific endopeptidase